MQARFSKNDNGFICQVCGAEVEPLGYTSRDHCPYCLSSIHIDINPGDRENDCLGVLVPVGATINGKKGLVINYKCNKCGQPHNNVSANDDDYDMILSAMNGSYPIKLKQLLASKKDS